MLVLCGLPISNYYSKVKLALLEKGVAFERGTADRTAGVGAQLRGACATRRSARSRSSAPRRARCARARRSSRLPRSRASRAAARCPHDPYAAAKVPRAGQPSSTCTSSWSRASSIPKAFFGGSDQRRDDRAGASASGWSRNIAAFARLARFAPYVAGAELHVRPTARRGTACRWSRWRAGRSTARTCSSLAVSTGSPIERVIGERPSAQRRDSRSQGLAGPCRGDRAERRAGGAPQAGWPSVPIVPPLRRRGSRSRGDGGGHFLAVAVQLLHAREAALEQQARGCAGCARRPCSPRRCRTGSGWSSQCSSHSGLGSRLWIVSRGNSWAVDVQVGRMQRLRRAARARHQHADLGEGGPRLVAELAASPASCSAGRRRRGAPRRAPGSRRSP